MTINIDSTFDFLYLYSLFKHFLKVMSLVVPPEYAKDVNKHSGFLNSKSQWSGKGLKGLWRAPPNVKYLTEQIYELVSHPQFVQDHSDVDNGDMGLNFTEDAVKRGISRPTFHEQRRIRMKGNADKPSRVSYEIAKQFKEKKADFADFVPSMIEEYKLPFAEDLKTTNPIMELHYVNLDFLVTSAEMLIQNPTALVQKMRHWNDDVGEYQEGRDYDYSAESWNDGTWHPEHLFTKSKSNEKAGYWSPVEVDFWNGPIGYPGISSSEKTTESDAIRQADILSGSGNMPITREDMENWDADDVGGRGPGNRYKHLALSDLEALGYVSDERRGDDRGLYNNTGRSGRRGRFANGGQFPFWQTTMHQRPYDRDNSEGLQDGGTSDRRVQPVRGYNMTDLTRKSGARKSNIPRQTYFKE